MLLVLIAVAVATILSMSFLASQATTHGVSQNVQKHAQARSVAESALVAAIHYAQTDSSFRTDKTHGQWVSSASFNGGTFDLFGYDGLDTDGDGVVDDTDGDLADDTSDPVTLTAIGYFDGVSHTVHAVVTPGTSFPAKTVLMIVRNDNSLDAIEQTRIDEIESWGWAVNILDDNSTPAEYNTAMQDVDAVLVAGTVNANSVSTKVLGASLGVVIEQGGTLDDMKIATGSGGYTGTTVDVVNNSHYITSEFGIGSLQVCLSDAALGTPGGGLASGMLTLAERPSSSAPVVAILETGAPLYGSGIAAGRRVWLPTGALTVPGMSSQGHTLFQHALQWASGGDADEFISGHWTLDDATGLAAYDSSGNGQHGPITAGSPSTTWTAGMIFGGLQFDGSGDGFIRIPDSDVLDLSAEGTLAAWVYLTDYQNFMGIIHKGEDKNWSDEAYSLQFWTSRRLAMSFTTATGSQLIIGNQSLQNGQWYHVVGAWGPNGMYLYVNGEQDASNSIAAVGVPSTGSVQIGSQLSEYYNSGYRNFPFRGIIDDARIYRRTLTANEVKAIYDAANASHDAPQMIALYEFEEGVPTPPAMVGHWKLDDASSPGVEFGLAMGDQFTMYSSTLIDSYSSSAGAYELGVNSGGAAVVSTNTTINNRVQLYGSSKIDGDLNVGPGGNPSSVVSSYSSNGVTGTTGNLASTLSFPSLSAPSGMPASEGNTVYNSGNVTFNTDRTFNDLSLNGSATITINGNIRVQVADDLSLNSSAKFVIPDGSSLELYVNDQVTLNSSTSINADTAGTGKLTLYMYGNGDLTMNGSSVISGTVYVGDDLTMNSSSHIYGAVHVDDDTILNGSAAIHIDTDLIGGMVISDNVDGNNGSQSGGVTAGVVGHGDGGTAIDFDGVDDYIEVAHDDNYLLDNGSLSFWFNSDNLSGHKAMISKDSTNLDTGGHLHVYTDGGVLKARLQSTSASYEVQSTGLSTGTWYHVVVSWGGGGLRIFRDGVERDTDAYTGGLGTNSGGAGNYEPMVFGAGTWTSGDLIATPITYPFNGRIDDVRIYDRGLNGSQADELYNGEEPSGGVGNVAYDTGGYGVPLDMDIENTGAISWVPGGGLTLDSPTRVSSASAATKLYGALTATNQMSVEVKFTPANATQSGPARIVSYSGGSSTRNFTFGQDADAFVTRLRTDTTTSNGTPDADSGSVLTAGVQEHVIVSYDGENITMYHNGGATTTLARTGDFNWDNSFRFMFGDEIDGGRDWLGTLHRVAVYDQAFNDTQASNVFAGGEPGDGTSSGAGGVNWIEP